MFEHNLVASFFVFLCVFFPDSACCHTSFLKGLSVVTLYRCSKPWVWSVSVSVFTEGNGLRGSTAAAAAPAESPHEALNTKWPVHGRHNSYAASMLTLRKKAGVSTLATHLDSVYTNYKTCDFVVFKSLFTIKGNCRSYPIMKSTLFMLVKNIRSYLYVKIKLLLKAADCLYTLWNVNFLRATIAGHVRWSWVWRLLLCLRLHPGHRGVTNSNEVRLTNLLVTILGVVMS